MKKSVKIIVICLIIVAIFIAIDIINNKVEQNNINNNIIDETTNNINENYISNVVNKNNKVTDNSSIIECKEKVKQIMSKMTLEEKVGQMFLARYPSSGVTNEIEDGKPGGYILFGRDFDNKTKSKIISELENNQKASKIKMILGVDEEGGTVVRVSSHKAFRSSKFLSPQEIYNKGGIDAVLQDSEEKSGLLKSLGINMNLAPVADITSNTNAFIYKRTLGQDVQTTANYIAEIVKNMKQSNIISVLKHFPGYGDNVDTDVIIPARYLNSSDPAELATHCMEDIDNTFVKRVQKGDIIVATKNFGCGSSREHAPIAIKAAGVSCVIAETFARIFYRNAINIGLPIIECPEASKGIDEGDEVEVDFDSGMIYNRTKGTEFKGQAFPEFMQKIIKAEGLVNYINAQH